MKWLVSFLTAFSACAALAQQPTYQFAVNQSLPPFSYSTSSGQEGLAVEMAEEVFKAANINAEIVPLDWSEAQDRLKAGKLDGLIHINHSEDRAKWLLFSGTFLNSNFHFFTRHDFDFQYSSPVDLKNYRIAVEENGYAHNLLRTDPALSLSTFSLQREAIRAVSNGISDVYIGEVLVAEYLSRELGIASLKYVALPFAGQSSRIAVAMQHPELIPKINNALRELRASGQYERIFARWHHEAVDFVGERRRTLIIIGVVALFVLVLAVGFLKERKQRLLASKATAEKEVALQTVQTALDEKSAALAKAVKAKEDKDRFIAQITHEFRTPLNTIYGTIKLLNPVDETTREAAAKIKQSARQLVAMTNNVLLWEKSVLGNLKPLEQIYSLRMMLDQITSSMAFKAKRSNNKWSVQCAEDIPDFWVSDWHLVRRVLENILDNAFKYCRDSEVSLQVEHNEKGLTFLVKDRGMGMAQKLIDQLADPFYEPEGYSNNRQSQGIGLGLAVSNAVTNVLGGKLVIFSEQNVGTFVLMNLPVRQADEGEIAEFQKAQAILAKDNEEVLTGYRILVVDDHELNLMINSNIFEHLGATVSTAMSSLAAEELVAKQLEADAPYDVIFMDLQMPEIDGFESIQRIREQHPDHTFNFVALTACDHESLYQELSQIGVIDVLHKPFEPDDAVRVILQSGARSLSLTKRILANISAG